MLISLITPTRERPDGFARYLRDLRASTDAPQHLEVAAYIDRDDPTLPDYQHLLATLMAEFGDTGPHLRPMIGDPVGCLRACNTLARRSAADWFMVANDDLAFPQSGWDRVLRDACHRFDDQVALLWFDDGIHGPAAASFPVVSRRWTETLGYLLPPLFEHFYGDFWLWELAARIGRAIYVTEIRIDHLNPLYRSAPPDDHDLDPTYRRNRKDLAAARICRDAETYVLSERYRQADAEALRALLQAGPWEAQRRCAPGTPQTLPGLAQRLKEIDFAARALRGSRTKS